MIGATIKVDPVQRRGSQERFQVYSAVHGLEVLDTEHPAP
jgi:hypothetical protein